MKIETTRNINYSSAVFMAVVNAIMELEISIFLNDQEVTGRIPESAVLKIEVCEYSVYGEKGEGVFVRFLIRFVIPGKWSSATPLQYFKLDVESRPLFYSPTLDIHTPMSSPEIFDTIFGSGLEKLAAETATT